MKHCKYCKRVIKSGKYCDYVCKDNYGEEGKPKFQKLNKQKHALIYCIGRGCQGKKKFWSTDRKRNRLCFYCRRLTREYSDYQYGTFEQEVKWKK